MSCGRQPCMFVAMACILEWLAGWLAAGGNYSELSDKFSSIKHHRSTGTISWSDQLVNSWAKFIFWQIGGGWSVYPGSSHRSENNMKVHKLRRKTVLALRKIFERKQHKQKSLNVSLSKECKGQTSTNIYVTLEQLKKPEVEEIRFKRDISECPSCIFGDPGLTCTCSFKQTVPDFKLYEDEEDYLGFFNS